MYWPEAKSPLYNGGVGLGLGVARGGGGAGVGVSVAGAGVEVGTAAGAADRNQTGLYSSYLLLLRFLGLRPSAPAIQTCLAPG